MDDAKTREHLEKMKDPTYDPTDNSYPYGTRDYVRFEFRPLTGALNTTIASEYKASKASQLVYDAKLDPAGVKCYHLCITLGHPFSCAICNSDALAKYTFHRIYDDHVESNIPTSCLCWIVDNTRVFYLDRDWAEHAAFAGFCSPICTHNCPFPDCFGKCGSTVIGHGGVHCGDVGRPIAAWFNMHQLIPTVGGPCLPACCPLGTDQWVCFPFLDAADKETFRQKLESQRAQIKNQYQFEKGKASSLQKAAADGNQSR